MVLQSLPPPACFRVLYDGVGEGVRARRQRSHGLLDLSVFLTPITSNGRGSAIAVARFDGQQYRLHHTEGCRGIDGRPLPKRECAALIHAYLPE
jgi:hypothetical protein